jgi:hypothetical protein
MWAAHLFFGRKTELRLGALTKASSGSEGDHCCACTAARIKLIRRRRSGWISFAEFSLSRETRFVTDGAPCLYQPK